MTPSQRIIAHLGTGPRTEMALIAVFIAHGYTYEKSEITVKNALVELFQAKMLEMPISNVYRLTAEQGEMEPQKEKKPTW